MSREAGECAAAREPGKPGGARVGDFPAEWDGAEQSMYSYWVGQYGYLGIFSLLVLGIVGVPVPDETLLTFVGYLSFKGDLHLPSAVAAAFAGSICGISVSYLLGRTGGVFLAKRYGRFVHVTADGLENARRWLAGRGRWALFFGYFIPGVRHLTAYVAGTSNLRYPVFAAFAYSGGLLWTITFVTLGYAFGREWHLVSAYRDRILLAALPFVILAVGLFFLYRYRGGNRTLLALRAGLDPLAARVKRLFRPAAPAPCDDRGDRRKPRNRREGRR
jgi:membrane protein DedA with SNARE-associated domain